jgi:hypothetical protein
MIGVVRKRNPFWSFSLLGSSPVVGKLNKFSEHWRFIL